MLSQTSTIGKIARNALSTFVFVWVAGNARVVCGQSALDGFDPNANGVIRVVFVQSDGKILLGGDFTSLAPNGGATVTRNRIARLNADGTLDAAFNPNANDSVNAIAVQTDGKVLAGGSFSSVGGQTRNRVARLDATTGAADSLNPNPSGGVFALAVQPDGKILAGGEFFNVGGQSRHEIARIDPTTGLADSFNPSSNSNINSIAIQSDGKILIGGGSDPITVPWSPRLRRGPVPNVLLTLIGSWRVRIDRKAVPR